MSASPCQLEFVVGFNVLSWPTSTSEKNPTQSPVGRTVVTSKKDPELATDLTWIFTIGVACLSHTTTSFEAIATWPSCR